MRPQVWQIDATCHEFLMDFSLRISCSLGDARKTQYRRVDRQVSHGFEAARLRCGEWLLQASKRRSITVTRNRKFIP